LAEPGGIVSYPCAILQEADETGMMFGPYDEDILLILSTCILNKE